MFKNASSAIQTAEAPSAALADARAPAERLRHLLVNGDALNPNALDNESVDLIVTSPPYNVGKRCAGDSEDDAMGFDDYLEFTRQGLDNCCAWTKPTGRICVNVSIDKNKNGKMPLSAHLTLAALQVGWKCHATILWNEGNISRRTAWGSWKSASAPRVIAPVETIIVLYKGEWKRERQGRNDIEGDEFKEWGARNVVGGGESARRICPRSALPARAAQALHQTVLV